MQAKNQVDKLPTESNLVNHLLTEIRLVNLPVPAREYRFHLLRRWRADLAWPIEKIIVEVEGGTYSNGRHVRPGGYHRDLEKYNAATRAGWAVYRFDRVMVLEGDAIIMLQQIFEDLNAQLMERATRRAFAQVTQGALE